MPSFYTILTDVGQAKLANAIALGQTIDITELAVGDGNGALPVPETSRTALVNEVRRAPINLSEVDDQNPNWVVVEQVLPPDVGGWTIREIGVYDIDGDLIGYGNYPETYKPVLAEGSSRTQTIRFVMEVSDTQAITLKVDPSVVLATRGYADRVVDEHAAETEGVHGIPAGKSVIHSGSTATTSKAGIVEKATAAEAKGAATEKYPDAAGVHTAFNQFGIGVDSIPFSENIDSLSKNVMATWDANTTGRPKDSYGAVLHMAGDVSAAGSQLAIDHDTGDAYFRAKSAGIWTSWVNIADADAALGGAAQSWQNVNASRSAGVTYTNTTGRPIVVTVRVSIRAGDTISLTVDGAVADFFSLNSDVVGGINPSISAVVKNGATYILNSPAGLNINNWVELR